MSKIKGDRPVSLAHTHASNPAQVESSTKSYFFFKFIFISLIVARGTFIRVAGIAFDVKTDWLPGKVQKCRDARPNGNVQGKTDCAASRETTKPVHWRLTFDRDVKLKRFSFINLAKFIETLLSALALGHQQTHRDLIKPIDFQWTMLVADQTHIHRVAWLRSQ